MLFKAFMVHKAVKMPLASFDAMLTPHMMVSLFVALRDNSPKFRRFL